MTENLERNLWLAICELNMKFAAARAYKEATEDEVDAEEWATMMIQDDLARIDERWGVKLIYDGNYSCTWGVFNYGMYLSLDEMLNTRCVESGF